MQNGKPRHAMQYGKHSDIYITNNYQLANRKVWMLVGLFTHGGTSN